jgi:hypothetical protein
MRPWLSQSACRAELFGERPVDVFLRPAAAPQKSDDRLIRCSLTPGCVEKFLHITAGIHSAAIVSQPF